jgi:hypothetical protein
MLVPSQVTPSVELSMVLSAVRLLSFIFFITVSFSYDSRIQNLGVLENDRGCSMACPGNSTELCGGEDPLSVYNRDVSVQVFPD